MYAKIRPVSKEDCGRSVAILDHQKVSKYHIRSNIGEIYFAHLSPANKNK